MPLEAVALRWGIPFVGRSWSPRVLPSIPCRSEQSNQFLPSTKQQRPDAGFAKGGHLRNLTVTKLLGVREPKELPLPLGHFVPENVCQVYFQCHAPGGCLCRIVSQSEAGSLLQAEMIVEYVGADPKQVEPAFGWL